MDMFKDLQPFTLILIIAILLLAIVTLTKVITYFAKNTSEKIVAGIKSDIQGISKKLDSNNTQLSLLVINFDAMHLTIGELFNGEYQDKFDKKKKELIQNAIFLRKNVLPDND